MEWPGRSTGAVAACAVAAAFLAVGGGPAGLLYLFVYAGVVLPGVPIGLALFGRNPAGWIAGIAIGYTVAVIVIWATTTGGAAGSLGFMVGLLATGVATWTLRGRRPPAVEVPAWTPSATASLAAVAIVTVAVAAPPLALVGKRDDAGAQRYRAYFTADFVWHTAMTAELTRFDLPPTNPYLAPQPIHYYWGYFLVPAAIARAGPPPLRDVERALKLNALATGLVLMSTLFVAALVTVRRAVPAAAATMLALIAGSLEGLYALGRLWSRHQPLSNVREMNVDALTAWYFQGHRIDGLPRCLWYVPQHSMSYALGLVALAVVTASGSSGTVASVVLAGVALGGSTLMNPFVGGVFCLVWGLAVVIDAVRCGRWASRVGRHLLAAIPVGIAIVWSVSNRMIEGAGAALEFGLKDASLHAPFRTLFLSLGPLLVAGGAGIVWARGRVQRLVPALVLAGGSLVLLYFVRLEVDHEWVPFRAGHLLLAALTVLSASWFAAAQAPRRRRATIAAAVVILLVGAPTTIIDAYNACDIWNTHDGPGFKWTLVLSPDQQAAFRWIRRETGRGAIVQMEPVSRERDSWSLIPSFAQRRMAAGLPISLLRTPEYRARSEVVKTIYATPDPREAARLARALHIRYLYVDERDRLSYKETAKFDRSPDSFATVFRSGMVAVYEVK